MTCQREVQRCHRLILRIERRPLVHIRVVACRRLRCLTLADVSG